MLSWAWALWRLCVSDFYQGKPIRPDRGMMILGHHHSGDTAPTNPTTPSSIRQPKTPSHAPSFSCSPWLPYPLLSLLTFSSRPFPSFPDSLLLSQYSPHILSHPIVPYFHCFISFCPSYSLSLSVFSSSLSLSLSRSLMANTKTNSALFLAHETFNISFQILADASKKWPNESYLLSTLSAITS